MSRSRLSELVLVLTLVLPAAAAQAASQDPLARREFDQDITLSMSGAPVVRIYDALASLVRVPFVLAFDEDDPSLKVSFKAKNMEVRGVLASLARTYSLEYAWVDGSVLVTRKGQPPTEKRKTVGPWQPPVPHYRLDFSIRRRDGVVVSTPWVTTGMNQEVTMRQGMQGAPNSNGDSFI